MARADYSRSTSRLSSLWLYFILDEVSPFLSLSLTIFRTSSPRQKRKLPQGRPASNFLTAILSLDFSSQFRAQKQPAGTFHSWFTDTFVFIESLNFVSLLVESWSPLGIDAIPLSRSHYRHAIISAIRTRWSIFGTISFDPRFFTTRCSEPINFSAFFSSL